VEILPGEGVGPFRFGLTEDELIRQLGSPDKRYRTDSGVERLQYFGPQVEFAIEPENGHRFGWAEVHHPDATLFGGRIVGERAADVVPRVTAALGEEPEREDLGSLETYFYPRSWVELHVRSGGWSRSTSRSCTTRPTSRSGPAPNYRLQRTRPAMAFLGVHRSAARARLPSEVVRPPEAFRCDG
jgi:hypothetical protein